MTVCISPVSYTHLPYKSENIYRKLEETERIKKEVRELEEKAGGRKAGQT